MPNLKVSSDMQKYALEIMRIPVFSRPIDNCPACGVGGFKDGICSNYGDPAQGKCAYMDPEVAQALQAWQQAEGIQQQLKAASAFIAGYIDYSNPSSKGKKPKPETCPICHEKTIINGECTNRVDGVPCAGEKADVSKGLGFNDPEFVGISMELLKTKKPARFLSPAALIEETKNKLRNKKTDKPKNKNTSNTKKELTFNAAKAQQPQVDPGMFLDDSLAAAHDDTTQMGEMLQTKARMDSQQNMQEQRDAASGQDADGQDNDDNS